MYGTGSDSLDDGQAVFVKLDTVPELREWHRATKLWRPCQLPLLPTTNHDELIETAYQPVAQ